MSWILLVLAVSGTTDHSAVSSIACTSKYLVAGYSSGAINCVDLATGKRLWTGHQHKNSIEHVGLLSDLRCISFSVDGDEDEVSRAVVWDLAAGEVAKSFDIPLAVYASVTTPDGLLVVGRGRDDGAIAVLTESGIKQVMNPSGTEAISAVTLRSSGEAIAAAESGAVLRIDGGRFAPIPWAFPGTEFGRPVHVDAVSKERVVALGSFGGAILVDAAKWNLFKRTKTLAMPGPCGAALMGSGRFLVVGSGRQLAVVQIDPEFEQIFDTSTRAQLRSVVRVPESDLFCVGHSDGAITRWNFDSSARRKLECTGRLDSESSGWTTAEVENR